MSMKMNGLDPAEKYLAHLQSENRLSAHTQLAYARDLKRLAEYLDAAGIAWHELRAEKSARLRGETAPVRPVRPQHSPHAFGGARFLPALFARRGN